MPNSSAFSTLFSKYTKPYPEIVAKLVHALEPLDAPWSADVRTKHLESTGCHRYLQTMKTHRKRQCHVLIIIM